MMASGIPRCGDEPLPIGQAASAHGKCGLRLRTALRPARLSMTKASHHRSRWFLLLLLLFAALTFSSVLSKSATYDEAPHLLFGWSILSGGADQAYKQRMPMTAVHVLPLYAASRLGVKLSFENHILVARSVTILLSVLLAFLIYRWSAGLYGRSAGLFALLLYVFEPNMIAHSRMATNDLLCSLLMFASIGAVLSFVRTPSWSRLFFWALVTGLAQATKQTALLLFPLFVLFLVYVRAFLPESARNRYEAFIAMPAGPLILRGFVFGAVVLTVLHGAYGFKAPVRTVGYYAAYLEQLAEGETDPEQPQTGRAAAADEDWIDKIPVPLPKVYVEAFLVGVHYNRSGLGHGPIYLLGRLHQMGFFYYFPLILFLKIPLGLLLLIAMRAAVMPRSFSTHPAEEFLLALSAAGIFAFFFLFCSAQIGFRYLLPMMPFLFVLLGRLWLDAREASSRVLKAAVPVCAAWMVISSLSFYPHFLSYTTEIVADRKMIYRYMADSNVDWGQNAYYVHDFMQRHAGENIVLRPEGPAAGTVLVNINDLVGVNVPPQRYAWLRENFLPEEHIAYSWLVFRVSEADLRKLGLEAQSG